MKSSKIEKILLMVGLLTILGSLKQFIDVSIIPTISVLSLTFSFSVAVSYLESMLLINLLLFGISSTEIFGRRFELFCDYFYNVNVLVVPGYFVVYFFNQYDIFWNQYRTYIVLGGTSVFVVGIFMLFKFFKNKNY